MRPSNVDTNAILYCLIRMNASRAGKTFQSVAPLLSCAGATNRPGNCFQNQREPSISMREVPLRYAATHPECGKARQDRGTSILRKLTAPFPQDTGRDHQ